VCACDVGALRAEHVLRASYMLQDWTSTLALAEHDINAVDTKLRSCAAGDSFASVLQLVYYAELHKATTRSQ
jgi:hypothetical protein